MRVHMALSQNRYSVAALYERRNDIADSRRGSATPPYKSAAIDRRYSFGLCRPGESVFGVAERLPVPRGSESASATLPARTLRSYWALRFPVGSELARAVCRSASKLADLRNPKFLGVPYKVIGSLRLPRLANFFTVTPSPPTLVRSCRSSLLFAPPPTVRYRCRTRVF